jgi:hypothetical protein
VVIDYQNQVRYPNQIKYGYWPSVIPGAEYKVLEVIRNPDNTVTEINRHGVKIVFQQTGSIGHFDMITLLINLVSAIALLKVASIIVEVLMLRFLPERKIYQSFKFEHTEDFGDLRKSRKHAQSYGEQDQNVINRMDPLDNTDQYTTHPPSVGTSERELMQQHHYSGDYPPHAAIEMNQR